MPTKICSFLPKMVICERIYEIKFSRMQKIIILARAAQLRERIIKSEEGWSYTPSERYKLMYEKLKRKL